MANAYLGIGHGAADNYITAEDTAKFNLAYKNADNFVSNYLNKFAYSIVDNNHISVGSGVAWVQGRPSYLKSSLSLNIDNGTTGYNRKDLIVMRLTRDVVTAIEEANVVVIKGTPVVGTPTPPAINTGDFNGVVNIVDYVLYEVLITNLVITSCTASFTAIDTVESRFLATNAYAAILNNTKQELLGKGNYTSGNFDTLNVAGTYNITGTALTNQPVALPGELSVFAPAAIAPIFQIFITTETNPRIFVRIIGKNWAELLTTTNVKRGQVTKTGTGVSYITIFTLTELRTMFGVGVEKTADNFVCHTTNPDYSTVMLTYTGTVFSGANLTQLFSGNLGSGVNVKINYTIEMF